MKAVLPIERKDILHLAYLDDEGLEIYYSYSSLMWKHRMVIYWYVWDRFFYQAASGRQELDPKRLISDHKKGRARELISHHSSRAVLYFQLDGNPYEIVLADGEKHNNCIFCITEIISTVVDTLKTCNGNNFEKKITGISGQSNIGTNILSATEKQLLTDRVLFHINFAHFLSMPLQPSRVDYRAGNNSDSNKTIGRENNPFLASC